MKTRLNFGIMIDNEGDAYPSVGSLDYFIPDDHRYLIDFLKTDLGKIKDLVEEGVKNRDHSKVVEARDLLQKIHPFMRIQEDVANVYINNQIARASWAGKDGASMLDEESFANLGVFRFNQSNIIDDYLVMTNSDGYTTVSSLINMQDSLKKIVFILLDQSNPSLVKYSFSARCGILGVFSDGYGPEGHEPALKIPASRLFLSYPESLNYARAVFDFSETENLAEKVKSEINGIIFNADAEIEAVDKLIAPVKDSDESESYIEYIINSLEELFNLEIYLMVRDGVFIRKCASCGEYFAYQKDADDLTRYFCDREKENGRTCLSVAREKFFSKELSLIYNRAYKTRFARVKAGTITKEELDNWRALAKETKEKVISGEIPMSDFERIITE